MAQKSLLQSKGSPKKKPAQPEAGHSSPQKKIQVLTKFNGALQAERMDFMVRTT